LSHADASVAAATRPGGAGAIGLERTMTNNLLVSFDVQDASREAPLILSAIEELGQAIRIFSNVWYVRTTLSAAEAARRVWDIMQPQDQLMVVDVAKDEAATFNLSESSLRGMQKRWHLELELPEPQRIRIAHQN
jgi:hypothetical protein